MKIAVVGAHLTGQPLNKQLTDRHATLVTTTRTAPIYKFCALANTTPPKPGLVKVKDPVAHGIELELWDLAPEAFASFVDAVPPPMCIGTIQLEDHTTVKGFLVEPYALEGATDITSFGGWRNYLASMSDKRTPP